MLDEATVAAYLDRISAERPARPDSGALRRLHERHVLSVPFESIDYHLGAEIYVDQRSVEKIVYQRRGGGCAEVNTAFYFLLEALGFEVTLHSGRVWIGDHFTPQYNHLLTTVAVDGQRWIVDIGFGKNSRYPLLLDSEAPQPDPHGTFTVRRAERDGVDVHRNGKLMYRFQDYPAEFPEFQQCLWWYRTCPESIFLKSLWCSIPTETGWVTLKHDVLTIVEDGRTRTEKLSGDEEIVAAYDKWFGIRLDAPPTLSPHYDGASVRMSIDEA